jgi:hypothetical protein
VTRNPITNPRRGDILRHGKTRLRVLVVDSRVHYEVTVDGARGIAAYPVQRMCPLPKWRTTVAEYDTVEAK